MGLALSLFRAPVLPRAGMGKAGFDPSRLEAFAFEKMSKTGIPGLSIAVVNRDGVIYARGIGFRDVEKGLRATPRTSYCVGSVTKSFTALAIMQLAEKGVLSLDDPVEEYVPLKVRPFGEQVRIWHLLTHSSGIPALAYAEALIRNVVGDEKTWVPLASPEDVLTFMSDAEGWVECRPGERFFYLNEGYVLLGHVIEKASGMRYEEYVRESILKPLKMERSYFSREEFDADEDKATPYLIDKEGARRASTYPFGISADGGLISNAMDLANYLRMFLNRGEFEGSRLISEESVKEMEEPRVKLPYELFGNEAYGYGWSITPDFLGRKLVGHSGSVLVSTAYVGYLPEEGVGIAVLANLSGYPLSHIGFYGLALALGEDPEELPVIKKDRLMDRLAGEYETYMGTYRVMVVRRGDFLFLEVKGRYLEESQPLVPVELGEDRALFYTLSYGRRIEAEFRVRDGQVELIFERYKFRRKRPLLGGGRLGI